MRILLLLTTLGSLFLSQGCAKNPFSVSSPYSYDTTCSVYVPIANDGSDTLLLSLPSSVDIVKVFCFAALGDTFIQVNDKNIHIVSNEATIYHFRQFGCNGYLPIKATIIYEPR